MTGHLTPGPRPGVQLANQRTLAVHIRPYIVGMTSGQALLELAIAPRVIGVRVQIGAKIHVPGRFGIARREEMEMVGMPIAFQAAE